MNPSREMTAEVRRALDERWPRVQKAARSLFEIIEAYAGSGTRDDESRIAARSAAHKLNGTLGTFGRRDASTVAATIEELLSGDGNKVVSADLRSLVEQLGELIGR